MRMNWFGSRVGIADPCQDSPLSESRLGQPLIRGQVPFFTSADDHACSYKINVHLIHIERKISICHHFSPSGHIIPGCFDQRRTVGPIWSANDQQIALPVSSTSRLLEQSYGTRTYHVTKVNSAPCHRFPSRRDHRHQAPQAIIPQRNAKSLQPIPNHHPPPQIAIPTPTPPPTSSSPPAMTSSRVHVSPSPASPPFQTRLASPITPPNNSP